MKVGGKIKQIREALGLTQVEFARPLGVGGNYISELEKEKGTASNTLLTLLKMYYKVNETWWDTDCKEGAMFLPNPDDKHVEPASLPEDKQVVGLYYVANNYGINPELADLLLLSLGKLSSDRQSEVIKDLINKIIDLLGAEEREKGGAP
jgi:transcriptional regulator with XRE-family HTH domain